MFIGKKTIKKQNVCLIFDFISEKINLIFENNNNKFKKKQNNFLFFLFFFLLIFFFLEK